MKTKPQRFVFEVVIDAFPHNPETVNAAFGGGYNSDFPVDTFAREKIDGIFRDAYAEVSLSQMAHLSKHGDPEKMTADQRSFYDYLEEKLRHISTARDNVKFVRVEDISTP